MYVAIRLFSGFLEFVACISNYLLLPRDAHINFFSLETDKLSVIGVVQENRRKTLPRKHKSLLSLSRKRHTKASTSKIVRISSIVFGHRYALVLVLISATPSPWLVLMFVESALSFLRSRIFKVFLKRREWRENKNGVKSMTWVFSDGRPAERYARSLEVGKRFFAHNLKFAVRKGIIRGFRSVHVCRRS